VLPGWLPLPLATVLFTGACEIFGAVGLLTRRAPRSSAMPAICFVVVYMRQKLHSGRPKPGLL
jgi:uncharacterized membrane protein